MLEIRPTIKWDKGKALEFLLEALGFANSNDVLPVYIGDDRTDEDAFKVRIIYIQYIINIVGLNWSENSLTTIICID